VPNTHRATGSRARSPHLVPPLDERTAAATVPLRIDKDVFVQLRPAAIRRDLAVTQLIQRLLGVIAADRLTDAILDDDH
jgi:hypothetical protein